MNFRVRVQSVHCRQQLGFSGVRSEPNRDGMHPGFLARLALGAYVNGTRRVLTHQHLGSNLLADGLRNRGSIQNLRAHRAKSTARVSRMTTTLICPGYWSSFSIFRAIESDS